MDDPNSPFEIIEDEPPEKPKRKRKRKYRPLFGSMPWRLLAVTFIGGIVVASIALGSLLVITSSSSPSTSSDSLVSSGVVTRVIVTRAANDPVYRAAWAGNTMAAVSGQTFRVYPSLENAPLVMENGGFAEAMAVSADGTQAAVLWTVYPKTAADSPDAYNPIDIWDVASGQKIRRIEAHTALNLSSAYGAPNAALAYSPDGARLASGARDETIRVWDTQTGKLLAEIPTDGTNATLALAFTADGQHLAAVVRSGESPGIDDDLRVWNAATYQLESSINLQAQAVSRASFSPDGQVLGIIANDGGTIELRDTLQRGLTGTNPNGIGRNRQSIHPGERQPDWGDVLAGGQDHNGGSTERQFYGTGSDALESQHGIDAGNGNAGLETDYLNITETANLHFEPDNQWLDYVPYAGSTMLRWNLTSGEIKPFDL